MVVNMVDLAICHSCPE